ncbi:MAG: NAD-dependent succinate-semialdehyde dehydrogenase [Alphaproteobacteria bacterium]|nr:NAD-dependent succinate-semialdehyde dehydrogenase [Alphaproteobacteria bacterium]
MSQPQRQIRQDNRKTVNTYNPATGEVHKTYYLHSKEEAGKIIEDAHKAFLEWRETSFEERAKIFNKIADILERDKTELAEMMTRQMGKPVEQGEGEVALCANICRYTAENGPKELADEERDIEGGKKGIITYQPIGVILGMQPWNFPFYQCMRYSMAVIMAGNSTVFKHATICFETAERIQKIYEEAGLPEDVFSVIYVDNETADELIAHEKVRGVTYTGSAKVGKIIAKEAGEHLKKTVLELGGSDPYIVLKDADIDDIISTCVEGRINNGGQTCIAAKRFIIEEPVYEEFKEKFVEAMKAVKHGDPMDRDNDMGPMANEDLREKLHDQVKETLEKGGTCLCGGEIPDGEGYFYPATVLEDIPKDSPAYKDELFGPVAALFKAKDENEAIEIANDHRYGLGGGIFSGDEERAIEIARKKIDTGIVNVNTYGLALPNMPFGGVKESGYGREHGGFGLKEFVNIKSVLVGE